MSKIIYVCFREKLVTSEIKKKLNSICNELNPDNISGRPPIIHCSDRFGFGIQNPSPSVKTKEDNVLMGNLLSEEKSWHEPEVEPPDGNFAIFRNNGKTLEVLTDYLGTRTVWYFHDNEKFIASTSQKALIRFLGDFKFDERVIPWVLSTGSLGPSYCWDKRLKRVPSDGKIILDKANWLLKVFSRPVDFSPSNFSDKQHEIQLRSALQETFQNMDLNLRKWAISLSGGRDSRAILLLFREFGRNLPQTLQTVGWGERSSLRYSRSDAHIAKLVAKEFKTTHKFCPTDLGPEPIDKVIDRFLHNGEGRIDYISGYLDGFSMWKRLYEDGIEGTIRGDEVFGYNKLFSPLVINNFMGLSLCREYSNLKKYDYINSLTQETPAHLKRKKGESIPTWKDRIFQMYRIPIIQSALADLKYPYIEQVNPFLSKKIVSVTRRLPDHLRANKKLFKKIMNPLNPPIPFAKVGSNALLKNVLRQRSFVELIKSELCSSHARTIFPQEFLEDVKSNMKVERQPEDKWQKQARFFKNRIPSIWKRFFTHRKNSLTLDENILGFRIFLICRIHRNFTNHPVQPENDFHVYSVTKVKSK